MATRAAASVRMPADARREQLLDATKAIVGRSGFHAVSIEAVAREAGITRPVVYGHFGDLTGLLEALVEREAARANAQLERILPDELAEGDARGRRQSRSSPRPWRRHSAAAAPTARRRTPSSPRGRCRRWPTRRLGFCSQTP